MSSDPQLVVLRLGHSPDPDDAFMWWPLLAVDGRPPRIDTGRFRFEAVAEDIETLNARAQGDMPGVMRKTDWRAYQPNAPARERQNSTNSPSLALRAGETDLLEITAISCAQYPRVKDRYAITSCGSSMGEGYGPKLVARRPMTLDDLKRDAVTLAVPGERTSAFAVMNLMVGRGTFGFQVIPFDEIIPRVADGDFQAGLIIHEGQLTFAQAGLHLIADVGQWWWERCSLPLPLGLNVIRRDLDDVYGPGTMRQITGLLNQSLTYALAHRDESIEYAMRFARGMTHETADDFIRLYVNSWSANLGPRGQRAVRVFLRELAKAGLAPESGVVDFVDVAVANPPVLRV
jgi:1,4-dihydroxy-6-naphthoate synthase